MATKRGFLAWRAFSRSKEATFDTAATIDSTENHLGSDPIALSLDLVPDTDVDGGYEDATRQDEIAKRVEGEHSQRLTPNAAGLFLAYAMGNVSTVANEPAATFYTHTITPRPKTFASGVTALDISPITVDDTQGFPATGKLFFESDAVEVSYTSKTATTFVVGAHRATVDNEAISLKDVEVLHTLPSMTVLEEIGLSSKYQYTGVVVSRVEIEAARKQFARITATLMGSGTRTTQSTARPSILTAEPILKAGDATVLTGGTWDGRTYTGGANINTVIRSFRWAVINDIEEDDGYLFNGGFVRGRAERIRRSQEFSISLELHDNTYLNNLVNSDNVVLRVHFDATSSYALTLIFPRLRFRAVPMSGGVVVLVTDSDMSVLQHGNTGSVHVDVINLQDGYVY